MPVGRSWQFSAVNLNSVPGSLTSHGYLRLSTFARPGAGAARAHGREHQTFDRPAILCRLTTALAFSP